jgi:transposase
MANKSIDMSKLRRLIQLHEQGRSNLFISKYLELSRTTVIKYLNHYKILGWPTVKLLKLNDIELEKLFIEQPLKALPQRLKDLYGFFPCMDKRLRKPGVTKTMLWKEYLTKHPDGFMSTQFCEYYRRWSKKASPVMHINHKAGDKMYVDYAGKKLELVDEQSGEIKEVEFFVATLGASQYTYAEATPSQSKEDFIQSVENALLFYGGVPAAIVPDNLKAAVTKSNRYEPTLNETFKDFAEHYNTTVLPARAYKPKDKALVEGAVKILYTRIYAHISSQTFHDLKTLNQAIWSALEKHNQTNLSGRSYSRLKLFNEIEKQELSPLPVQGYEIKNQTLATVMLNGHVCLGQDKHYYSVPYQFIRKKVKLLYSNSRVEIFYKYNRIAIHKRSRVGFNYTTIKEHMASTHQFITDWNPQKFIDWGGSIDPYVKQLIINILEKKQHPEQAYKSCMGILSLDKKVGRERLINACKRALEYNIHNYKIVINILERGLDHISSDQFPEEPLPKHDNIRGKKYYN